jgi:hypothetical protein
VFQAVGGNIMTSSPISDLNPIFNAAGCQLELHSKGKNYYVQKVTGKIFLDLLCYNRSQLCNQNIEMNSQQINAFLPITTSNFSDHYWETKK